VSVSHARVASDGKFLRIGDERFLVRGVTYGTFAPDGTGRQFPSQDQVADDFRQIAALGLNTVRLYTLPRPEMLDLAASLGLRVIAGLPWSQHVAFLDDRALQRSIEREIVARVSELADHPAILMFAVGNEIPPSVVRWHGRRRVEAFLQGLYYRAKDRSPQSLFTYVNFPPTEFLDLSCFDVCSFNVYVHHERQFRSYLARLQHIAGYKPLLLTEAGADSIREGEQGQAAITAMQIRVAFEEGACGAVAFAWTDEWWRGGHPVSDWAFGLVDRNRRPKAAAPAVQAAFAAAPFSGSSQRAWPRVSVVVCAHNASETLDDCLNALERLTYPDYELIVVDDGSSDRTGAIARSHTGARVIGTPGVGLSAARNIGLAEATGEIVAYTDADTRADRDWLNFLVQPFLRSDVVASGGPNVVPSDDPPMAQAVARAPGSPTHVLLDDRVAEHIPGCNMAFRREALLAVGGFNPTYVRAGDDVDVCWRLQARGWTIGFAAAALVWHHHRATVGAYWQQQVGYGEGERWLMAHHPEKFLDGRLVWNGRIYSPLPFVRALWNARINAGVWGTAQFPSVYRTDVHPFAFLPHSARWQLFSLALVVAGFAATLTQIQSTIAVLLVAAGVVGLAVTIAKDIAYALRSEVDSLDGGAAWYRGVIALLHFLQPLARLQGHIRGALASGRPAKPAAPEAGASLRLSSDESWRALVLVSGSLVEDRFWTETWTTVDRVLGQLAEWLRRSRAVRAIEIDQGWSDHRDISVLVGRWAWLDIRALVEDHGSGKGLLRVSTHLRLTGFGITAVAILGVVLLIVSLAGAAAPGWVAAGGFTAAFATAAFAAWRTAHATAIVRRGIEVVALRHEMVPLEHSPEVGSLRRPILRLDGGPPRKAD
jgi:GT2 family glycosyltransferase